jgi:caffeoyl-CoA O-methyltransferase
MSAESFLLSDTLAAYVDEHCPPPDAVARDLIEATSALGDIEMMRLSTAQASFLGLLVQLLGARSIVEVGTFTGYSTLHLARAAGPDGRVIACDVSEDYTAVGRPHWERAGVADRIDLRLAPALDTLRALPAEPSVDLAFVDADKGGYVDYHDELVPRLRPGGLLVADNVLWYGTVVDPENTTDDTEALRRFNDHAVADPRTETILLPVGDGFLLSRRLGD